MHGKVCRRVELVWNNRASRVGYEDKLSIIRIYGIPREEGKTKKQLQAVVGTFNQRRGQPLTRYAQK